jgi:hypothetical protein
MSLGKLFRDASKEFIRWVLETDKKTLAEEGPVPAPIGYTNSGMTGYGNAIKSSGSNNMPVTFNFTVTNATGGKVITVRQYDPRTDRTSENVYIITDKEDLGEELGQIITKESLSR